MKSFYYSLIQSPILSTIFCHMPWKLNSNMLIPLIDYGKKSLLINNFPWSFDEFKIDFTLIQENIKLFSSGVYIGRKIISYRFFFFNFAVPLLFTLLTLRDYLELSFKKRPMRRHADQLTFSLLFTYLSLYNAHSLFF